MAKNIATQVSPKTLAARINGAKGGKARAANNTKAELVKWAAKGGKATLDAHGADFFAHAQSLRKVVGRYRTPVNQTA